MEVNPVMIELAQIWDGYTEGSAFCYCSQSTSSMQRITCNAPQACKLSIIYPIIPFPTNHGWKLVDKELQCNWVGREILPQELVDILSIDVERGNLNEEDADLEIDEMEDILSEDDELEI